MRNTPTLHLLILCITVLSFLESTAQQPWQIEHSKLTSPYFSTENSKPNPTSFDNMVGATGGKEIGNAYFNGFNSKGVINSLALTIFWGLFFTYCQYSEYIEAPFSINDSVYGSIFYMATGFHGFHVLIGTLFLIVCFVRHIKYHFLQNHHLGFEFAIWYWHFVDVVWIFLYGTIYVWGS